MSASYRLPGSYTLAVAYREYLVRLHNPIFPLWDVLVPVVYLVIFGASLERWLGSELPGLDYPTFFLAGVLSMVTFNIAMNSSYAFFEDFQSGVFFELLTYPLARRDLLLGKLAFSTGLSLLGALLCVLAGAVLLKVAVPVRAILPVLLWMLLGAAGWFLLFSWISVRVRSFNAYHTTTSAMYLLLMFVSNLFYPADRLPEAVQWAAWLNPVTWQNDLLRHAIYGGEPSPPPGWTDWSPETVLSTEALLFAVFVAVSYWLANRVLNGPIE